MDKDKLTPLEEAYARKEIREACRWIDRDGFCSDDRWAAALRSHVQKEAP